MKYQGQGLSSNPVSQKRKEGNKDLGREEREERKEREE
jgi:hypothetical protein